MESDTPITKEKIMETLIGILKKRSRFRDMAIHEKTHFGRDLNLDREELATFIREVEKTYQLSITSNVIVFVREIGQLAFYIESQIFKKN